MYNWCCIFATVRVKRVTKVHFKRLGNRSFHDLSNHYICFFPKHNDYNTAKQKHKGLFKPDAPTQIVSIV